MQKVFLLIGGIMGALSVMIGAFGAHALKELLIKNGRLEVFETAVKYQFYHTLALILVGLLMFKVQHVLLSYSGIAFIVGTLIFSGSLYILAITNVKWWGAITPIGGLGMIVGWICFSIAIYKTL